MALAIHFLPVTDLFLLNRHGRVLVFVLLGAWAAQEYPQYTASVDRHAPLVAGIFAACLLLFMIPGVQARFDAVGLTAMPKFIAGLLSIPAIHGLIRTTSLAHSRWLLTLGHYTFPIYLMNTITIGLVKGVLLKFFPWDGLNFLIYAPFLFAGGLLLPILIRERLLGRVSRPQRHYQVTSWIDPWRPGGIDLPRKKDIRMNEETICISRFVTDT